MLVVRSANVEANVLCGCIPLVEVAAHCILDFVGPLGHAPAVVVLQVLLFVPLERGVLLGVCVCVSARFLHAKLSMKFQPC
eukprot:1544091-Alexandrium_andersonii.AAC.1